jgi:hypothetical protein
MAFSSLPVWKCYKAELCYGWADPPGGGGRQEAPLMTKPSRIAFVEPSLGHSAWDLVGRPWPRRRLADQQRNRGTSA